jgi:sulfate transport system permease protein
MAAEQIVNPPGLKTARDDAAPRQTSFGAPGPLATGVALLWLSLIVLVPLAFLVAKAAEASSGQIWDELSDKAAISALLLSVGAAIVVALVNAVVGTITAWVLIRDDFVGKPLVNALIDLPFAIPTVVAGLVLLVIYGPDSPIGVNIAFTRWAVLFALLFVTLPFVVRAVQPVLLELDREMEEAASSLGASAGATFRRIILPNLLPAIASGAALAFARAVGEFGSLVLITGSIPNKTEVMSVLIFKNIENDLPEAAAVLSVELLLISVVVLLLMRLFGRTLR